MTRPIEPNSNRPVRRLPAPRGLVVLNAVLLAALVGVSVVPHAGAQNQPNRARGEYTLVGGEISGGNSNAIYVLDAANREMIALLYEPSRRLIQGVGYRDLATDLVIDTQR
ncbi:MAG: hypothetical protein LAT64_05280 [Phycisphaerales bacterium]|nr:hypothetical protein [Planctomycetota bacterium]MCH8508167.1 hypothetical protein [Phycisphaerales bacterium]